MGHKILRHYIVWYLKLRNLISHFELLISWFPDIAQKCFCTPDGLLIPLFTWNMSQPSIIFLGKGIGTPCTVTVIVTVTVVVIIIVTVSVSVSVIITVTVTLTITLTMTVTVTGPGT